MKPLDVFVSADINLLSEDVQFKYYFIIRLYGSGDNSALTRELHGTCYCLDGRKQAFERSKMQYTVLYIRFFLFTGFHAL